MAKSTKLILAETFRIALEDLYRTGKPDEAKLVALIVQVSVERPLRFANPKTLPEEVAHRYRRTVDTE